MQGIHARERLYPAAGTAQAKIQKIRLLTVPRRNSMGLADEIKAYRLLDAMQLDRDSQELARMNGIRAASRQVRCLHRFKTIYPQIPRVAPRKAKP
jgi:hypothetical protein